EYLEKSPDAVTTILPTEEPEHSLSMGYEHLSTIPETELDEVTESSVKNLVTIPSECEVTSEDEIDDDESLPDEDVPAEEFKIYSNPLFDEDEINSDKLDPHCFNVESNFVESLLNRDAFIDFSSKFDFSGELAHIKPEIPKSNFDFEEEIRLIENLIYDNSFPRSPEELNAEIADTIIESIPLLPIPVQDEEADLFLVSDNSIPPGIENVADDPEGDIRFLEELLINDSILSHESYDSNFENNPSISRPPPEPTDDNFDLEPEVISAVMEDIDEPDEHFESGREINVPTKIEDDYYFPFMFVIRFFLPYFIFPDISPLFLSAESEDTIFDPEIEVILCRIYVRFPRSSYPLIDFSLGSVMVVINHVMDIIVNHEPSYNQNYDDNYYSHDLPSYPCCDYCGGSHKTFQCQPDNQNVDFSGSDQIQSPQYPEIHNPSQADVEEVLHNREKFIQDTQTFLEKFNRFSFGFTPRVLTISWERIDKIKYVLTEPEEIPELMYKLREDVRNIRKELAEYIDSPIWNCPTFFYDEDEEYTIQYREYLEKSPDAVTTILPTEEPEHSLSMGYEHLSTTLETELDEVIESSVKNLVPITSECGVTSEDEIECDKPAKDESSSIFTIFSNPLFDYNDDFTSSNDESLPDEDVPAEEFKIYSNPLFDEDEINSDKLDPHCFNVESDFVESLLNQEIRLIENLLYDNSFPRPPEELNTEIADTIVESIPLLPIPVQDGNSQHEEIDIVTETDDVLPPSVENDDDDNDSLLEEAGLFLVSDDSIPPGIENFADDLEGDICFLEELLIDDSILSHESFDFPILRITRQFHDLFQNRLMLKLM
nr:hypothetical protein [Tanacetum cinerariifolium]